MSDVRPTTPCGLRRGFAKLTSVICLVLGFGSPALAQEDPTPPAAVVAPVGSLAYKDTQLRLLMDVLDILQEDVDRLESVKGRLAERHGRRVRTGRERATGGAAMQLHPPEQRRQPGPDVGRGDERGHRIGPRSPGTSPHSTGSTGPAQKWAPAGASAGPLPLP